MGEFGLTSFKTKKWIWIILKRDTGSTYAVITTVVTAVWLEWREGSCGWLQGRGHYWNLLCAACTGMGKKQECRWMRWWWMMDVMPLRDFLLHNEMNAFSCRWRMKWWTGLLLCFVSWSVICCADLLCGSAVCLSWATPSWHFCLLLLVVEVDHHCHHHLPVQAV